MSFMAVISALGSGIAQIEGQPGLHSKSQANLGYKGRPLIHEIRQIFFWEYPEVWGLEFRGQGIGKCTQKQVRNKQIAVLSNNFQGSVCPTLHSSASTWDVSLVWLSLASLPPSCHGALCSSWLSCPSVSAQAQHTSPFPCSVLKCKPSAEGTSHLLGPAEVPLCSENSSRGLSTQGPTDLPLGYLLFS